MSILDSILYWWNNQGEIDTLQASFDTLMGSFKSLFASREQLKFLLSQAPIIEAPMTDYEFRSRLRASTIAFAYVNPKTVQFLFDVGKPVPPYIKIPTSATKWVLTEWMPVGTVIFSPNAMPGME